MLAQLACGSWESGEPHMEHGTAARRPPSSVNTAVSPGASEVTPRAARKSGRAGARAFTATRAAGSRTQRCCPPAGPLTCPATLHSRITHHSQGGAGRRGVCKHGPGAPDGVAGMAMRESNLPTEQYQAVMTQAPRQGGTAHPALRLVWWRRCVRASAARSGAIAGPRHHCGGAQLTQRGRRSSARRPLPESSSCAHAHSGRPSTAASAQVLVRSK
jgi:hypothetical protein